MLTGASARADNARGRERGLDIRQTSGAFADTIEIEPLSVVLYVVPVR